MENNGNSIIQVTMECCLAEKIMETVNKAQLPFKLDIITQGDGNCFSRAIAAQCQRQGVIEQIMEKGKHISDYRSLKKRVT